MNKIINKLIKLSHGQYYCLGNCTEVVNEDEDETDMNITYDINDATQLSYMVENSIQISKERLVSNLCIDALRIFTELTKDNKEENYSYWYSEDYDIYTFYDDEKDIHTFFGFGG